MDSAASPTTIPAPTTSAVAARSQRRHGLECPFDILQIIAIVVYTLFIIGFCALFVPLFPNSAILTGLSVTMAVLGVSSIVLYVLAAYTMADDPLIHDKEEGERRADDLRFCTLCDCHVDATTKHCMRCNKCVIGFDHHCRWLNNCVGARNYKVFILFLGCTWTVVSFKFCVGVYLISRYTRERSDFNARLDEMYAIATDDTASHQAALAFICIFVVLSFTVLALLSQLVYVHIVLTVKGITTYQRILDMRHQAVVERQEREALGLTGENEKWWHASCHSCVVWCHTPPRSGDEHAADDGTEMRQTTGNTNGNGGGGGAPVSGGSEKSSLTSEQLQKHQEQLQQQAMQNNFFNNSGSVGQGGPTAAIVVTYANAAAGIESNTAATLQVNNSNTAATANNDLRAAAGPNNGEAQSSSHTTADLEMEMKARKPTLPPSSEGQTQPIAAPPAGPAATTAYVNIADAASPNGRGDKADDHHDHHAYFNENSHAPRPVGGDGRNQADDAHTYTAATHDDYSHHRNTINNNSNTNVGGDSAYHNLHGMYSPTSNTVNNMDNDGAGTDEDNDGSAFYDASPLRRDDDLQHSQNGGRTIDNNARNGHGADANFSVVLMGTPAPPKPHQLSPTGEVVIVGNDSQGAPHLSETIRNGVFSPDDSGKGMLSQQSHHLAGGGGGVGEDVRPLSLTVPTTTAAAQPHHGHVRTGSRNKSAEEEDAEMRRRATTMTSPGMPVDTAKMLVLEDDVEEKGRPLNVPFSKASAAADAAAPNIASLHDAADPNLAEMAAVVATSTTTAETNMRVTTREASPEDAQPAQNPGRYPADEAADDVEIGVTEAGGEKKVKKVKKEKKDKADKAEKKEKKEKKKREKTENGAHEEAAEQATPVDASEAVV